MFFFSLLFFFFLFSFPRTHLRFFTTPVSPQAAEACELGFFFFHYQIFLNLKVYLQPFFSSLMRLLDMRYAGVARGVGTAKMLGRVHGAQLKLADLYLPCPFTVMQVLHAVNILSFF